MFLKTLVIKGFKSFADTTTLEFQPGVTVVVGPNGSGKSNIVDAVAWVLGSQSPTTIRSSKMDDVIFAGTAKKQALGRAQVELTIDNSSGMLPVDLTEVTISRTLFRSGESEYAINGVPCRLLDIQEMLSDSGVGRQQHVIVSQGQLDAVLSARPEDRRAIVEEAAGVLKYRRRREKAQRRLDATEGNLQRLQDLLREVRRQLRPLERQADAARRHGDLVDELQGIRLYLAGRELATHRSRMDANKASLSELTETESSLRSSLAGLDSEVINAEMELSTRGGDDLGDALMRFEALRQRAKGLRALLSERRRSVERELSAFLDTAVVATLEADSARLSEELTQVDQEIEELSPRAQELVDAQIALEGARSEYQEHWGSILTPVGGAAAESRGELAALRAAVERGSAELSALDERVAELDRRATELEQQRASIATAIENARRDNAVALSESDQAEAHLLSLEAAVLAAQEELRSSDREAHVWAARVDTLSESLDMARARAGAEKLAEIDGVVGTLLDLVEVDTGWESAFEAGLGEALRAVVVRDVSVARRAIGHLRASDAQGAVLALDAPARQVPTIAGGATLREHVRSDRNDVNRLLDTLLSNVVVVDQWEKAIDLASSNAEVVAVTRDGDRFGVTAWRRGTSAGAATAAALDDARHRADDAVNAVARLEELVTDRQNEVDNARHHRDAAIAAVRHTEAAVADLMAAVQRSENDQRHVATERDSLRAHIEGVAQRIHREEARVMELEKVLPELEADEAAGVERASLAHAARTQLDEQSTAIAAIRTDIEVRSSSLKDRREFLSRRLDEVEERLRRYTAERAAAGDRRQGLQRQIALLDRLGGFVEERSDLLEASTSRLHEERRRRAEQVRGVTDRLDALRRDRNEAERRLSEVRERQQRLQLEEAETRMRLEAVVDTIRREFDLEPDRALGAECPQIPENTTPANRARELERELRLMGPINPLALEEFNSLQERHQFLEGQLDDVKSGRRELARVIRAVDEEIVQVASAAYADVSENFTKLFETLFPGGTGRLTLTDPHNLLETGIELEARPSGKNLRKLSLLSGGERSLTALAFLFAVFRSRPSPFYLMDEVEAALDDVNLHRFLALVDEFRAEAQLLIVSHQKRTMEAADILYGVSMQPGGSSRVISERVAASA